MLRTEHLTKDYGRFRALDGLDLEVAGGEVFGILGPNGSGKTTALRLVMGFLRPTAGSASVAGHDMIEGIRSTIVDKDRNPQWRPAALEEVTPDIVERHFKSVGALELKFAD